MLLVGQVMGMCMSNVTMRMLTCAFFLACLWSAIRGYPLKKKKTQHARACEWIRNMCTANPYFLTNLINIK